MGHTVFNFSNTEINVFMQKLTKFGLLGAIAATAQCVFAVPSK